MSRIIFAGSPAVAVPSLDALLSSSHEVVAVVTREDAPVGRRRVLTPTPVAVRAEAAGLTVIKANRLAPVTDELIRFAADIGVIVAFGAKVDEPLLSAPRYGWINLHFSLLPAWRGASPVARAIMAGDSITGSTVFQLVPEWDAGPVFDVESRPIGRFHTAGELLEELARSGALQLRRVVDAIAAGTAVSVPQVGEPSFAPKVTTDEARVDWNLDAAIVDARIRGTTPEPGAWTILGDERLGIVRARVAHDVARVPIGQFSSRGGRIVVGTRTDPIELLEVGPAGRRAMSAADWWRGRRAGAPDEAS